MKALAAVVLLVLSLPAAATDIFEPFSTSNLNPFVQVYGLPATRSANQSADNEFSLQVQTAFSSNFTSSSSGTEAISIDGETHRLAVALRYGITDRLELGVELPYLRHTGGSMDSFIENWHKLFGLPNSGRGDVRDDQLDFHYRVGGVTRQRLASSASGIGDVSVSLGYQLRQTDSRTWALRAGVKLPTGDADDFTGSDGTDVYASVHYSNARLYERDNWSWHGNLGVLAPGSSDILGDQLEDWVLFGSGTLAWAPWERVSLKAQLDFHSAFYDSQLEELGDPSTQLLVGGSIQLNERLLLDISVAEDILTDRSPDVVFQLGLRSTF